MIQRRIPKLILLNRLVGKPVLINLHDYDDDDMPMWYQSLIEIKLPYIIVKTVDNGRYRILISTISKIEEQLLIGGPVLTKDEDYEWKWVNIEKKIQRRIYN